MFEQRRIRRVDWWSGGHGGESMGLSPVDATATKYFIYTRPPRRQFSQLDRADVISRVRTRRANVALLQTAVRQIRAPKQCDSSYSRGRQ